MNIKEPEINEFIIKLRELVVDCKDKIEPHEVAATLLYFGSSLFQISCEASEVKLGAKMKMINDLINHGLQAGAQAMKENDESSVEN